MIWRDVCGLISLANDAKTSGWIFVVPILKNEFRMFRWSYHNLLFDCVWFVLENICLHTQCALSVGNKIKTRYCKVYIVYVKCTPIWVGITWVMTIVGTQCSNLILIVAHTNAIFYWCGLPKKKVCMTSLLYRYPRYTAAVPMYWSFAIGDFFSVVRNNNDFSIESVTLL